MLKGMVLVNVLLQSNFTIQVCQKCYTRISKKLPFPDNLEEEEPVHQLGSWLALRMLADLRQESIANPIRTHPSPNVKPPDYLRLDQLTKLLTDRHFQL